MIGGAVMPNAPIRDVVRVCLLAGVLVATGCRDAQKNARRPAGTQPKNDLSISISAAPTPGGAGQPLTCTVTVTNHSSLLVERARVDLGLPGGSLFIASLPSECEQTSLTQVLCAVEQLASGNSRDLAIVVFPAFAGTDAASARIYTTDSGFTDVDPSNDSAQVRFGVDVVGGADLALAVTVSPQGVSVGEPLTYSITVTNNGPEAATEVVVTDELREHLSFTSASTGCTAAGTLVTCASQVGSLPPGASETFVIVATTTGAGPAYNLAAVTSGVDDQDFLNGAVSNITPVAGPESDLSLSVSDFLDPGTVGQSVTYQFTITNHGPDAADAVAFRARTIGHADFVSLAPSQESCAQTGDSLTCDLATLGRGGTATVDLVVTPGTPWPFDSSTLFFTATVSSRSADFNASDNAVHGRVEVLTP